MKLAGSIRFVVINTRIILSASYKTYLESHPCHCPYVCGVLIPRESDTAPLFTGRPHPPHGPLSCLRADKHYNKKWLARKTSTIVMDVTCTCTGVLSRY